MVVPFSGNTNVVSAEGSESPVESVGSVVQDERSGRTPGLYKQACECGKSGRDRAGRLA